MSDDSDRAGIYQRGQFRDHLASEVRCACGELDDRVVDGTEFVQGLICHFVAFAFVTGVFA